jgi:aspartate 1-decarboxylase
MGSITIDADLMDAADLVAFEQVHIYDITNGERLVTYAVPGARGTGVVCINGAAAHRVRPHDLIIIASYAQLTEAECQTHQPRIVLVDQYNRICASEQASLLTEAARIEG